MCKFSAAEIVSDNLMTREQIIAYLQDDFRIDLSTIRRIAVVDDLPVTQVTPYEKIPHHRYKLSFDRRTGTLYVQATEGRLRVEHLKIETAVLSEISGQPVAFDNSSTPIDVPLETWLQGLRLNLRSKKIHGAIIGSMWNLNFYLRFFAEGPFSDRYLKDVDATTLAAYIDHQIALAVIEEEYLTGQLELKQTERSIFQEGDLADPSMITRIKALQDRIPSFSDKMSALRKKTDFLDYIKSDFIFFSDLQNRTSLFKQTLTTDGTAIFENNFLSYQLIDIKDKTYINFNWANAEILSAALCAIDREFGLKSFHMYGKCGSLVPQIKVGQMVAPVKVFDGKQFIEIKNQIGPNNDITPVSFINVESPLLETRSWAKSALGLGCDCVDMELASAINSVPSEIVKSIVYYVSDEPVRGMTLSDRLGMLKQRLKCSHIILTDLIARSEPS